MSRLNRFNNKRNVILILLLGILVLSTTAHAQMKGKFDDADANHDGHITLSEFDAYVEKRMESANGPRAQMFKQMTPDEQATRLKQRFDNLDTGHKGYLDKADWSGS